MSLLAAVTFVACREDPGPPRYPERVPYEDPDAYLGPFPFEDGDERLSLGAFYEGGYSEIVPIDGVNTNYFIYENTYTQADSDDRLEGLVSAELTVTGAQLWWGGGIIWAPGIDLASWTTMHVSLRASDPLFAEMDILVGGGGVESRVKPADYGFAADDQWHSLVIPLADFTGVDLADTTVPASFLADAGTVGSAILVDDLYYTQE